MFEEKPPCDNSQKLKTQRESMGLSLEDVFKKIRIRSSYLDAMEKGEFNLLPDAVYTKNFIKIYAKFLGVDEDPILSDYNDYLNSQKEELAPLDEEPPEPQPIFASIANKKKYVGIIVVLIVVFAVWLIVKQNTPAPEEINLSGKVNVPVAEVKDPIVNASPNATPPVNQQQTTDTAVSQVNQPPQAVPANVLVQSAGSGQKSTLLITASQETWLRITPGENPPIQMLLKPGEKIDRNEEKFNLDIGNAGGITIQYKGKYIENVGKSGEVVHIQLPQIKY